MCIGKDRVLDGETKAPSQAFEPRRGPHSTFVVQESPETVLDWMKTNIRAAPQEKLYEALATALAMREGR